MRSNNKKLPDNYKLDSSLNVNIDLTENDKNNIISFLEINKDKHIRLSTQVEGEVSWSGNDGTYITGFKFLSYVTI